MSACNLDISAMSVNPLHLKRRVEYSELPHVSRRMLQRFIRISRDQMRRHRWLSCAEQPNVQIMDIYNSNDGVESGFKRLMIEFVGTAFH